MSCLSEATIVAWLEARLSDDDRQAAQAHVLECPACLELVAASRMLRSSAADAPLAVAGDDPGGTSSDRRYQIGVEIGAGGMGRVFESRDLALGRTVAIKMVRDPSSRLVARFRSEVAIASRLQHPSIIPVYDAGTFADGSAFCVMRLVNGVTLDEAIEARPAVSDRLGLMPAVIQAADAIAFAHSRDVIHRDLKPQNIVLGPYGETIVLDWGLAKLVGGGDDPAGDSSERPAGMTETGAVVGTPAYMAPEQKRGEPADKRSDVYALGMILGQVIAGSLLSRSELDEISLRRIPKELVAIAERATQADPERRYSTAQELAEDLKRFETGQLVSAQRYSRLRLLGRWAKRRSGYILAAALLAVLAGGALITDSLITEARRDAESAPDALLARRFIALMSGAARRETLDEQRATARDRERLAASSPEDTEAQSELATAYHELGDTLFRDIVGAKDHDGALVNYRKALEIRQSIARASPTSRSAARELARTHEAIGDVYYDQYRLPEALASYERANRASGDLSRARRVARVRYELGDDEASLAHHQAIVESLRQRLNESPDDSGRRELSLAHGHVAKVLSSMGRDAEARRSYRASLALAEAADYRDHDWKRALALHHLGLGRLQLADGEPDAARRSFASCASLYADFGFSTDDAFDAACCSALAGDADAAFRALHEALEGNWYNTLSIENNPDFAGLRIDPRWRSLLGRMDASRPK